MNTERVNEIIEACTQLYRKSRSEDGHYTEMSVMPFAAAMPSVQHAVDVHFYIVGVIRVRADYYKEELVDLLCGYPDREMLYAGPSYTQVAYELGSKDMTLRLYALGEYLKCWEVITPESLGFDGDVADQLAKSAGLVLTTGFDPVKALRMRAKVRTA